MAAGERLRQTLQPFRRREQGHRRDRGDAPLRQHGDHGLQGAAGGEHRVQDERLTAGQVGGQPVRVGGRDQRLLVPDQPHEADVGHRQQPDHAVQHADAGPQHGHDERRRAVQLDSGRFAERGHHGDRLDADLPGRLVGQQRDEFVGEPPEGCGLGANVAQRRQLVRDQRVIDNQGFHGSSVAGPRRPAAQVLTMSGARRVARPTAAGRLRSRGPCAAGVRAGRRRPAPCCAARRASRR